MLRALIASGVAAVVLFVWGFAFWTLTPFPKMMMKPVEDDSHFVYELEKALPESGCYVSPNCATAKDEEGRKAVEERMTRGPMVMVFYRKEGHAGPLVFLYGYAHMVVSALLASFLLTLALPNLQSFGARWLFVALLGIFASVWVTLSGSIWMMQPWEYSLISAGFEVGGWVLAGLVLAAIIRPTE